MADKKAGSPNSIKYSIWQTRTEEIEPGVREKLVKSSNRTDPEQGPADTRD